MIHILFKMLKIIKLGLLTNADRHFSNGHQLIALFKQLVHDCTVDDRKYVLAQKWHTRKQRILELKES